jgi:hypothetical protein
MAEYLFVGGPFDGQRREVPDGPNLFPVSPDGYWFYNDDDGVMCFVSCELNFNSLMAALLASYRPKPDDVKPCKSPYRQTIAGHDGEVIVISEGK